MHKKTARLLPSNEIDGVMVNRNMEHPTVVAITRDIERKNKAKTELIEIPATVHTTPYLNADSSTTTEQAPQANTAYFKTFSWGWPSQYCSGSGSSSCDELNGKEPKSPAAAAGYSNAAVGVSELSAFIHLSMSGGALGDFVKYFSQSGPSSKF
jgi:hypothetical protein